MSIEELRGKVNRATLDDYRELAGEDHYFPEDYIKIRVSLCPKCRDWHGDHRITSKLMRPMAS
jgi:hypothetical protein